MDNTNSMRVVQMLQDYIEENLQDTITLKQLADYSNYSPWYIGHMFKETIGKSPYEYIRLRRLTMAALVMRDENKKVIDVALDFVFDSQEGFTRAFTKEFGISPYRYHKQTPPIQLFLPNKVYDTYRALEHVYQNRERKGEVMKTVFVQIVERPERKCLIKRGRKAKDYFEYCEEVGCDIWNVLTSVKEALYEPIGMWMPESLRNNASEYVQGVELPLDYDKKIPEGYELIVLPPCTMMVFQGEPYDDEKFGEAIEETWEHIDKFNPELYGYKWAPETGPRFQLAPMGYRGYIEAKPVQKCGNN
ncbi:MAG: AraC family transcriptional regulator [Sedimentibacter sp.]|uniref:AraC family transcriptional regulator n=1 Tax=Sedimentibacter sp. TaxID=1960295 RepID=UPI0031583572